jgi:sulfite reductase (ferredoxin)
VATRKPDVSADPAVVAKELKDGFVETKLFWDTYAGGKFAQYYFQQVESPLQDYSADAVHRLVEESQLFIEAAHACRLKLQ